MITSIFCLDNSLVVYGLCWGWVKDGLREQSSPYYIYTRQYESGSSYMLASPQTLSIASILS